MALTNSHIRYGAVTKWFHWLTALLILTLIPLGIVADELPFATADDLRRKVLLFSLHKTLGITTFFVALARILWALSQPKPGLLNADNTPEAFLARTIHWLLYSSLLLVPVTGWIHHAATEGFAPIWWPFSQNLPLIPTDNAWGAHLFGSLHRSFERVLAFSVLLHIAGALKHHLIDRDATLRRMLPGRPELPPLPAQPHSPAPILAALGAYVVALIAGVFLWYLPGLGETRTTADTPSPSVTAGDEAGNWVVRTGSIAITVRQLGNAIGGEFGDWSSTITFDDTVTDGVAGTVTTDIAIGSLSLGTVTAQALGSDFLDAEGSPTATFKADIIVSGNSYTADGALTLNGITVPLKMPFALRVADDTATMSARLILKRLDFGVGRNLPDGSSLGLDVTVDLDLTATGREN